MEAGGQLVEINFLSTLWVLEIELRLIDLVASDFILSHLPRIKQ